MTITDVEKQNTSNSDVIKVLLIGDSQFQSSLISKMLSCESGFVFKFCQITTDPALAVATADKFAATIILINLNMANVNGFDLLRLYRKTESTANVPILILSSKDDAETKATAFTLGANDYIVKTDDKVEFVARIRNHAQRYNNAKDSMPASLHSMEQTKHSIKVLMVDDAKMSVKVIESVLAREDNITFQFFHDPDEAVKFADEFLPTVILMPQVVGNFSGIDMLKLFRENSSTSDVPIIILSSSNKTEQKVMLFAAGANDYVIKSNNFTELVSRIRSHSSEYFSRLKSKIDVFTSIEESRDIKVFMVDDSKMYCTVMGKFLADEENVELLCCSDAEKATQTAKKFSPTVILQDLNMPKIDGFDLLRHYREEPATREIPVIVLSATSDPAIKAKAFTLGANDFMEKKADKVELMSRIEYHTKAYNNASKVNVFIEKLLESQKKMEIQRNFIRKTFGRYISDAIVDRILESPDGLELGGEKRDVTIMMTDLRGFTRISERLAPEQVIKIINNYLSIMTEILMKFGGTIDEFIGDAILAIFGAPIYRKNHAKIALICAMEMQIAMKTVNEMNRKDGLPDVEMGIGLNTGEVVVGNIGSEKRTKYGVVGKNVNLTSRIESYTTGNQIFISESCKEMTNEIVKIRGEMTVEPKGVIEPIIIYDVHGIGGDYNLFLEEDEQLFQPLVYPIAVNIATFEGKSKSKDLYAGKILKLSQKGAIVSSNLKLKPFTNINLTLADDGDQEIDGEIFAKVLKNIDEEEDFTVEARFTYVDKQVKTHFEEML